jgi:hypothetical protein
VPAATPMHAWQPKRRSRDERRDQHAAAAEAVSSRWGDLVVVRPRSRSGCVVAGASSFAQA